MEMYSLLMYFFAFDHCGLHSVSVENIHRVWQWRPPKKAGLDPIVASFHFVLPCAGS
jgi:hypothetical protein